MCNDSFKISSYTLINSKLAFSRRTRNFHRCISVQSCFELSQKKHNTYSSGSRYSTTKNNLQTGTHCERLCVFFSCTIIFNTQFNQDQSYAFKSNYSLKKNDHSYNALPSNYFLFQQTINGQTPVLAHTPDSSCRRQQQVRSAYSTGVGGGAKRVIISLFVTLGVSHIVSTVHSDTKGSPRRSQHCPPHNASHDSLSCTTQPSLPSPW